ncbi:uncharacterized protein LOC131678559 [Topomyia yanbarensis]|uniref:uncharacterized protein LOC131678559 n=1 Tax=Topomyia yanbarensis TaxID=2498891 RepID=UPI00273C8CC4|nr:uncharacterized protein LOC131678559 [Topomyia yanbarensis]
MQILTRILLPIALLTLVCSVSAESRSGFQIADKKKQNDFTDDEANGEVDVMYDERQTEGETNIRLHVKNFQIQVPESSLSTLKETNMAAMIRSSILRLFEIPHGESNEPSSTQQESSEQEQQQELESNSMLQINGNNLPAKFFLEISDFLMNNHDNDAVDDKRVESNHNKNAEIYATEEIKIERLENVNNVKNETITISKKRYNNGPAGSQSTPNQTLLETTNTENKFSNNVTHNHTEKEDRFQQTRPIRLDTVVMQVKVDSDGRPKTLREKVIWRMDGAENDYAN